MSMIKKIKWKLECIAWQWLVSRMYINIRFGEKHFQFGVMSNGNKWSGKWYMRWVDTYIKNQNPWFQVHDLIWECKV